MRQVQRKMMEYRKARRKKEGQKTNERVSKKEKKEVQANDGQMAS